MAYDTQPGDNLYMKGLPPGTTEDTLRAIFGVYGTVISCKVLASPAGLSDTAALVRMSSVAEAQYLVENAVNIAGGLGTPVQIKFANSGNGKGSGKMAATFLPVASPSIASPQQVSTRLYMKGLPLGMSEEKLMTVIGAYGTIVSLKVLQPPPGGATDSAAIVQLGSEPEAQWLVENLDGNIPQGLSNPVQIKYKQDGPGGGANPMATTTQLPQMPQMVPTPQPPMSAGPAQDPNRGCAPSDNLYMRGLPSGTTEEKVMAIFGVYGTVVSVKVFPPPAGKSDVASLIRFANIEEAAWLVENLNGNIPQGLSDPISVRFADNLKGSGKGFAGPTQTPTQTPTPVFAQTQQLTQTWPLTTPSVAAPAGGFGGEYSAPSANLYMKGLPTDIADVALKNIFAAYGTVMSVRVLQSPAGVDNAAALVQMSCVTEAEWLVNNVNGNIPEGLSAPIMIKFANNGKGISKGSMPYGAGDMGWNDVGWNAMAMPAASPVPVNQPGQPSDNLYMKGFHADIDENGLRVILGPYGNIVSVKVLPPPTGKSCAAALVRMSTREEAKWLVDNMNGNIPQGQTQPVEVKYAANSGGKPTTPAWQGSHSMQSQPLRWNPW